MDYLPDRIAVGHNLAAVRAARDGVGSTSTYATFTHHATASSTYATFTHHSTANTNQNGILATAAHFSSYYSLSQGRQGAHKAVNHWKLPVIIVAAVVGAIAIAAAAFFLIKRRRRGASYRNLEKPTLGEHRDVFDARISEALESDAQESHSTAQRDGDYAHPYGEVDTSYRGPDKPYTEKSHDQGA